MVFNHLLGTAAEMMDDGLDGNSADDNQTKIAGGTLQRKEAYGEQDREQN